MHAIHTTPGFIIGSKPYGDAGKVLSIFTRKFGLVRATAQGIRLERSKLRYHVVEYSLGMYSLVRGHEYWRLTSAQAYPNASAAVTERSDLSSQPIMAGLALLLGRLLQGEEAYPTLFDHVEACASFLSRFPELTSERIKTLESLAVFRILAMLGYVGQDPLIEVDIGSSDITLECLDRFSGKRAIVNQHINKALRESHL